MDKRSVYPGNKFVLEILPTGIRYCVLLQINEGLGEMDNEVTRERLGKLSAREREVLSLFCEGKPYKEIAKSLFIVEKTVRVHMGNIYAELGLDYLEASAERRKLLHEIFCPLLKEDLPPPPEEPKALVPISPDLAIKVDEDDALIRVEPEIIDWPPPHPPRRDRARRDRVRIALLLLIGLIVGIGGTTLVLNWLGFFGGASAQVPPTSTLEQVAAADGTQEPSETPMPSPTETMTATITPTLTPLPPTATPLPLPFSDNFNSGAASEWDTIVGNWRMVDGAYTASRQDERNWNVSLVGSESWRDIAIEVDAITDNWNWPVRIIVRAYQGSFLVMETNCCETKFILIDNGIETEVAESETGGLTGSIDWHTNHIRIEIRDNIFTVFVDGVKLLTVQDNTLPTGRVGLSLEYEARFDNFLVEPLSN